MAKNIRTRSGQQLLKVCFYLKHLLISKCLCQYVFSMNGMSNFGFGIQNAFISYKMVIMAIIAVVNLQLCCSMMQVVNEQARITTERVSNLVWKEN